MSEIADKLLFVHEVDQVELACSCGCGKPLKLYQHNAEFAIGRAECSGSMLVSGEDGSAVLAALLRKRS